MATADDSQRMSRLFVYDKYSGKQFLVDSGACVSVYPKRFTQRFSKKDDFILFAVNNTRIATYGTIRLTLNLNLRRDLTWNFIVADVKNPILGADFLESLNFWWTCAIAV